MKRSIFVLILICLLLISCTRPMNFKDGLLEFNSIMQKHSSTFDKLPNATKELETLKFELKAINQDLTTGKEPFKYLIDYTKLLLESEELKIRGESYGSIGKASDGFGCKQRPLIMESATFRNNSAQKGFESLKVLQDFQEKYPTEA